MLRSSAFVRFMNANTGARQAGFLLRERGPAQKQWHLDGGFTGLRSLMDAAVTAWSGRFLRRWAAMVAEPFR